MHQELKRDTTTKHFIMRKYAIILILLMLTGLSTAFLNWDWSSWDNWDAAQGQAGVISMDGQIMPSGGGFGADYITPERVDELNDKAIEQGADAIIYEWNSGGGAVVASKEVMDSIDSVEVPTVCRFRDISASGAYLASLGCDKIVSDSATLTGSIGVSGSYLEFSELLNNYGINYVNATGGEYKEVGSPFKNATDEEVAVLENLIDQVHEEFLQTVEEERDISEEDLEEISTGRVILGSEAEEFNMVDTTGRQNEAVAEAENLSEKELSTFKVQTQQSFSFLDLLFVDSGLGNLFQEYHLSSRLG